MKILTTTLNILETGKVTLSLPAGSQLLDVYEEFGNIKLAYMATERFTNQNFVISAYVSGAPLPISPARYLKTLVRPYHGTLHIFDETPLTNFNVPSFMQHQAG